VKIIAAVIAGIVLGPLVSGCGANSEDEPVYEHTLVRDANGNMVPTDAEPTGEAAPGGEVEYSDPHSQFGDFCQGSCSGGICRCTGSWSCCMALCNYACGTL